jgi:hypothetical protein
MLYNYNNDYTFREGDFVEREIPQKLIIFLKDALKDVDDGFEYSSELYRLLRSDECQINLKEREIDTLREFADKVKNIGEIDCYSEEKIKDIECEVFGNRGILGYLGVETLDPKSKWPF